MKRITLLTAAALMFSTAAAMAAPFSDVPASHWSYDAISTLAGKGILQGYPDGTFKGNRTVTRYALGMVTAKMLATVEQMLESGVGTNLVTKADLATLEKLTVEFADELALIGVKVTSLEDDMTITKENVGMLKRDVEGIKDYMAKGGMEKVKLSGDMLVRHTSISHRHDWAINPLTGAPRAGNGDNSLTESLIGLNFTANIDENISAVVYWAMLDYNTVHVNSGQSGLQSAFGLGGIGAGKVTDSTIYLAYLEAKNMFRFGGDFLFGRNMYSHGHSLLINNYLDTIRYSKKIGSVDMTLQTIFDRHIGSYKDNGPVDSRGIWNLNLGIQRCKHDLYLGIYSQDEPNLMLQGRFNPLFAAAPVLQAPFMLTPGAAANSAAPLAAGVQSSDKRWDVEFGSKGPIGKSTHWDYDLGFAYTNYQLDVIKTAAAPWVSPDLKGWMGHGAIKWDSKKEWAAKLAISMADDESVGAISALNDMRYQDAAETPYEDIGRGNTWFDNGLLNMSAIKLQTEYRPKNSKHYFRLAGDFLDELSDAPVNSLNRHFAGQGLGNAVIVPAGNTKNNTAYDCWNSIGIADPKSMVLTFEYRYQLAENTRLRVGFTQFEMTGSSRKAGWTNGAVTPAVLSISGGNGLNNDYDYRMFWSEIYSLF